MSKCHYCQGVNVCMKKIEYKRFGIKIFQFKYAFRCGKRAFDEHFFDI